MCVASLRRLMKGEANQSSTAGDPFENGTESMSVLLYIVRLKGKQMGKSLSLFNFSIQKVN